MRTINDTIKRLSAHRARARSATVASSAPLSELRDFGSNPGALRALYYVPAPAAIPPTLVVVLHGCTQNASNFDNGSGWSELAKKHGFAVLLPEQTRANNFNLCFNWYERADNERNGGEPVSIVQMVDTLAAKHGIDRARVFVTGLSAGGAMAAVMLATYPEVFAGGAIVAGLPYGCAGSIPEAFDRMRGHGGPSAAALAKAVRSASSHPGPWPSVSVWHGTGDAIVDVSNAKKAVEQWRQVHGVGPRPTETTTDGILSHQAWRDPAGRLLVEEYLVAGMGHGTPLATTGVEACGSAGAYMLDVGVSSTHRMAEAWGLTGIIAADYSLPPVAHTAANDHVPYSQSSDVGRVIEDALRAAGLMR